MPNSILSPCSHSRIKICPSKVGKNGLGCRRLRLSNATFQQHFLLKDALQLDPLRLNRVMMVCHNVRDGVTEEQEGATASLVGTC